MNALKPIETLATELGARDANLLVADGMMTLTMEELLSLNTETAKVLAESLVVRYVQRRNSLTLNLMAFMLGE